LKEWALDPAGWKVSAPKQADPFAKKQAFIHLKNLDLHTDIQVYYKERWINENNLEQKLVVTFSPKHRRYQGKFGKDKWSELKPR